MNQMKLKYKFEALEAMTNAIAFFARIKYKYVKGEHNGIYN